MNNTSTSKNWVNSDTHRHWLFEQASKLLDFYQYRAINPRGGFFDLDDFGRPLPTGWPPSSEPVANLFQTTRMVHCFALANLMGRPGAASLVEHGMKCLWEIHRDKKNGGYFWSNGLQKPVNDTKQHYGHAFVLLAASSAKMAGHPDADRLLQDITEVLNNHFWEETYGAGAEEFYADWTPIGSYRGQNSNMHLTEALMAAYEATDKNEYLDKAVSIADLLINRTTSNNEWRLPEHYTSEWRIDFEYGTDVFRPFGSTIGHWLEWTRLILQLWQLTQKKHDWMKSSAVNLFEKAVSEGWDSERGGFYFTVDWSGKPVDKDRYWWPCTEGIGAAYFLLRTFPENMFYETWYRKIWDWCSDHLIDHQNGGWFHQLDDHLNPINNPWYGKPDIYHCLQSYLIPLLDTQNSVGQGLLQRGISLTNRNF